MSDDADDEESVIVLDIGSGLVKAGFPTDEEPRVVASVLCRLIWSRLIWGFCQVGNSHFMRGPFFGAQVRERILRGAHHDLRMCPAKQRGQYVRSGGCPDNVESVLYRVLLDVLRVDPTDGHLVILLDAPLSPRADREDIAQVLFETFDIPAIYFANEAVLILQATGRTTGVVVDVGDGVTDVVVIKDGTVLYNASERVHLAGCDVTDYLLRHLRENGEVLCDLTPAPDHGKHAANFANYRNTNRDTVETDIARTIKEKTCYVALDFAQELSRPSLTAEQFELPDSQVITLGNERFLAPEVLFQPHLLGRSTKCPRTGLHELVNRCIQTCDLELQGDLFRNVILTGGTSLCTGFADRMKKELVALAPDTFKVKVIAPEGREFMGWRAAAAWEQCRLQKPLDENNCEQWVTMSDYNEYGPTKVHRK